MLRGQGLSRGVGDMLYIEGQPSGQGVRAARLQVSQKGLREGTR